MKWWLVAILMTRFEAFDIGAHGDHALEKCDQIAQRIERNDFSDAPPRLKVMLDLNVVLAITCIDDETVAQFARGNFGRHPLETPPDSDTNSVPETLPWEKPREPDWKGSGERGVDGDGPRLRIPISHSGWQRAGYPTRH